ncbi:winged helix-turn-helix transcriptional regulator [Salinigranum sp.]|uniref:winged helix-turn-helix transcriptional regulator n=1 Tax=Salinigranum sp. TaxID=1966351 RepID=UPI003567E064
MFAQTEKRASAERIGHATHSGTGRLVGLVALVLLAAVMTAVPATAAPTAAGTFAHAADGNCHAVQTNLGSLGVGDVGDVAEEVPSALRDGQRVVSHLLSPQRVPGFALLVGYERDGDGDTLANERRERVYRHVTAVPGSNIAELVRASGLDRSTLRYHLKVLERAGLVESRSVLGHHRVYPTPVEDDETGPAAALATRSTSRVVDAVGRLQPVRMTDLGSELGLATSTVSNHVDRLVAAGVLTREHDGRTVLVRLSPETRAYLD